MVTASFRALRPLLVSRIPKQLQKLFEQLLKAQSRWMFSPALSVRHEVLTWHAPVDRCVPRRCSGRRQAGDTSQVAIWQNTVRCSWQLRSKLDPEAYPVLSQLRVCYNRFRPWYRLSNDRVCLASLRKQRLSGFTRVLAEAIS